MQDVVKSAHGIDNMWSLVEHDAFRSLAHGGEQQFRRILKGALVIEFVVPIARRPSRVRDLLF
jgi:hypothetical protein